MFIFRGWDKKEHLEVRKANRDEHLKWLNSLGSALKLAGPTLDKNGHMNGSVLIVDFATKEAFINVLNRDPYVKAGLFEKTEISSFTVVMENFLTSYKID